MKINESTLITYATSSTCPTDKEDWLWKRGEVNKNFQKRYFVLKGNLLFYFEKKFDREPLGVIILEGCTIELAEEEQEMCAFKIVFHGEGRRTYYLGTDSQAAVEEWMKFLASASYDYMKLMVMELQQKLAEVEEMEKLQNLQNQHKIENSLTSVTSNSSRPNPFNQSPDTLLMTSSSSNSLSNLCASTASNPNVEATSNWAQIHSNYGAKISSDRDKWCLKLLQNWERIVPKLFLSSF